MRLFAVVVAVILILAGTVSGQGPGSLTVKIDDRLEKGGVPPDLTCFLVREDPNVTFTRVQAVNPGADHDGLLRAWDKAMRAAASASVPLKGGSAARFDKAAAGHYWVVTLKPLVSGRLSLFWAEPVRVDSTCEAGVVFSLSNAVLLLDSLDSRIH